MRGTFIALTTGLTMIMAAPVMAHDTTYGTGHDAKLQTVSASSEDQLVCKPITHEGMLLRRSQECHTKSQWQQIRQETKQDVSNFQMKSLLFRR